MESEVIEEIKRHFDVVAESLRGDIKTIAEGHIILNRKKIDELRDENGKAHQEMREEMWRAVKGLSRENEKAHQEILSAIKFSYAELDRRLTVLEDKYINLNTRLGQLEASR